MDYNVRPVAPSDFPRLIDLFTEFADFERTPEAMTNSVERIALEKDYFNALVVEDDNQLIIGYVAYFICYHTWTGKTMHMDDLYIQPDHRGTGLGKLLFEEMVTMAKFNNCHQLKWQVSRWNESAIGFYKKLNASITDVEMNCVLAI